MPNTVLELLEQADGFLSGEEMAQQMGISRAAVWKQVGRLRMQGYEIQAVTNVGYRLTAQPVILSGERVLSLLADHPWRDRIHVLETVDSTNDLAKREAVAGAPHGSVWVADEQTGGRGRQGRSFISPKGKGVYLTVLLRPDCAPSRVSHATAMAAVAACNAIEETCGVRPGIKWTNDLILGEKKCTGILSEMAAEWGSGTLEYLIIGIGLNCGQREADFPEELREKATSIGAYLGESVDREKLAACLIRQLYRLSRDLQTRRQEWISQYARDCITVGREVRVIRTGGVRRGFATGIDENGGLIVRYDSGETGVVFTGEVSVRGENGYL